MLSPTVPCGTLKSNLFQNFFHEEYQQDEEQQQDALEDTTTLIIDDSGDDSIAIIDYFLEIPVRESQTDTPPVINTFNPGTSDQIMRDVEKRQIHLLKRVFYFYFNVPLLNRKKT